MLKLLFISSLALADDSIIIDTDQVLDEIIHESQTEDKDDTEHLKWDLYDQHLD